MSTHFHKKPNMYVSHVQIKVSNLERSVEFYKTIIGFKILEQTKISASLTFDGVTSILSLEEVSNAIPLQKGQTGLYHFAILLPSRKDLGNFIQHIVKHNVRIGAGDHHVSEAIYLYDPDGNGIEVYTDRPENEWIWYGDSTVQMVTEQLNIQSILADATNSWRGLPDGTVMGHIHLSVANLPDSEKFYTEGLGYNIVARYSSQALFISTGKYHHHVGLNTWNSAGGKPAGKNTVGLKSFTLVVDNLEKAEQIKENLTKLGVKIEHFNEAPIFGGSQLFSSIDPSGNRIIFTLEGE